MRLLLCFILALQLEASLPKKSSDRENAQSIVTLSMIDSFGRTVQDCSVKEFVSWGSGDHAGADYANRFQGLVAKDIPYDFRYRIVLHCVNQGQFGPYWISVDRPSQFISFGAWLHQGDYNTGGAARLTISVDSGLNSPPLVKMIAVYLDTQETETLNPKSGSASFYDVVPGSYLVLVISGGRVVCTHDIDILGPGASFKLSVSPQGCDVANPSNVRDSM
jgi:hypothetical protein